MRRFYPPEGHDFVNSAEIRELESENKFLKERKYFDDLTNFRAEIFGKMQCSGGISDRGDGWSIFLPEIEFLGSSKAILPKIDLLLRAFATPDGNPSIIRIIRNERFGIGQATSLITHDFVADGIGNCYIMLTPDR